MQVTVLVDNNTIIDRYLLGEPGVSFLKSKIALSEVTELEEVGVGSVFEF
ncbi:MAG: hypothetical protein PHC45_09270 [Clostridiaceae bacterium]|nr:hypothetical protein [Clostridiaceae bacterium]